jgi:hypothetical protein
MDTKTKGVAKTPTKKPRRTAEGPHTDRLHDVRYIINEAGERLEVVMPVTMYEHLLNRLEDLEDIRDAREARAEGEWESIETVKARLGI